MDVKWCGESKKVGPNALWCLIFGEIRSFLKKMAGWDLWQKTTKPSFQKSPNFAKISVVEHWDQLFWIPCINLHQEHSLSTGKKSIFDFFHKKRTFLPLCHNNLRRFYGFLLLHSKTRLSPAFWFFHDVLKIKKTDPAYAVPV